MAWDTGLPKPLRTLGSGKHTVNDYLHRKSDKVAETRPAPAFDDATSKALGWLKLEPRDRVFESYTEGSGDPKDDLEVIVVVDQKQCGHHVKTRFIKSCKEVAGPRKTRSVPSDDEVKKGMAKSTDWERSALGLPVVTNPNGKASPPAAGKFARPYKSGKLRSTGIGSKEYMDKRGNAMFNVSKFLVNSIQQVSKETRDYMETLCDQYNCLHMGYSLYGATHEEQMAMSSYIRRISAKQVAMVPKVIFYKDDTSKYPEQSVLFQTPEDLRSRTVGSTPKTSTATIGVDGGGYAEGRSVCNVIGCFSGLTVIEKMSMLPQAWGIEFDFAKFLQCITYRDTDGTKKTLDPWLFVPHLPTPKSDACACYKPGVHNHVHSKFEEDPSAYRLIFDDGPLLEVAKRRKHYAMSTTVKQKDAPHIATKEAYVFKRDYKSNEEVTSRASNAPKRAKKMSRTTQDDEAAYEEDEEVAEDQEEDKLEEEDEEEGGKGDLKEKSEQEEDEEGDQDGEQDDECEDDEGRDDEGEDDEGKDDECEDDEGRDDEGRNDEGRDDKGEDDEGNNDEGKDDEGDPSADPSENPDHSSPSSSTSPDDSHAVGKKQKRVSSLSISDAFAEMNTSIQRSSRHKKVKGSAADDQLQLGESFVGGIRSITNQRRRYKVDVGSSDIQNLRSAEKQYVRTDDDSISRGHNWSDVIMQQDLRMTESDDNANNRASLLASFKEDALLEELAFVQQQFASAAQSESATCAPSPVNLEALAQLHEDISSDNKKYTLDTLCDVHAVWQTVTKVATENARRGVQIRFGEFFTMSSYVHSHTWLEDICDFGLKSLDDLGIQKNDIWVSSLASTLYQKFQARAKPIVLRADQFIPGWDPIQVNIKGTRKQLTRDQIRAITLQSLLVVVGQWVGFPQIEKALPRYLFLRRLVDHVGFDVENVLPLLLQHPITNCQSASRQILSQIGELYFLDQFLFRISEIQDPQVYHGRELFLRFLIRSLGCLLGFESGSLATKLKEHPNLAPIPFYVPAICVVTCKAPHRSPFASELATTRAGFFSALIWRVITYSSGLARDGYTSFVDLNHWKAVQAKHKGTVSYLFVADAYGGELDRSRHNGLRNAEKLWDASSSWVTLWKQEDAGTKPVTLFALFSYLQRLDCLCLDSFLAF
ncbi:hypothetical protein K474DRAFT_1679755 [Panus rudis PR-1116 ss-1]|nr:hypothetical protein K474DRAFT_1679755 [Panus rudis PR-1116 ss-1]